jgi:hypothetical protein
MNSENGSPSFRVIPSGKFERTARKLKKDYKGQRSQQAFVDCLAAIVDALTKNSRLEASRLEPIPKGVEISNDQEFRKLVFPMPGRSGASGEGRLMYLVNYNDYLIKLVWIYTHEEFASRPPEKDLKQLLQNILSEENEGL